MISMAVVLEKLKLPRRTRGRIISSLWTSRVRFWSMQLNETMILRYNKNRGPALEMLEINRLKSQRLKTNRISMSKTNFNWHKCWIICNKKRMISNNIKSNQLNKIIFNKQNKMVRGNLAGNKIIKPIKNQTSNYLNNPSINNKNI